MEREYGIAENLNIKRRVDKRVIVNGPGFKNHPLNNLESEILSKFNGGKTLQSLLQELGVENDKNKMERVKKGFQALVENNLLVPDAKKICDFTPKWTLDEVFLELTKQCNLRCHHCYIPKNISLKELTREQWLKVVDECRDMGVGLIKVTGGEPMIYRHFFDIIEYIMSNNMHIRLYTNGSFLSDANIANLKRIGITEVQISMDGARKKTHDTFRRTEGNFEKIMKALPVLENSGINAILSFTVTDYNENEMDEFIEIARRFSNIKVVISPYINYHQTICIDKLVDVNESIVSNLKQIFEKNSDIWSDKVRYSLSFSNKYIGYCGFGIYSLYIDSTGKIMMCPLLNNIIVGHISEGIENVWRGSQILNEYRQCTIADIDYCNTCKNINVCRGGCRARAYIANGTFISNDPVSCRMY